MSQNPSKEELVLKKVDHHFDGKNVFWSIDSLFTHYPDMIIHESDVIEKQIGEDTVRCIQEKDVDFNFIMEPVVENTVEDVAEEVVVEKIVAPEPLEQNNGAVILEAVTPVGPTPENLGMIFEDADELRKFGKCIALPEWSGFWFGNLKTGELLVLTKEGEIVNTPHEEYKERIDWMLVEPTVEQLVLIEAYYAGLESSTGELPKEKYETVNDEVTEILAPVIEQETVTEVIKEVVLDPVNEIEESNSDNSITREKETLVSEDSNIIDNEDNSVLLPDPVKEAVVKAPKKKASEKK